MNRTLETILAGLTAILLRVGFHVATFVLSAVIAMHILNLMAK